MRNDLHLPRAPHSLHVVARQGKRFLQLVDEGVKAALAARDKQKDAA